MNENELNVETNISTNLKQKKKKKDISNVWYLLVIVFTMAVIPLIVFVYKYDSNLVDATWYVKNNEIIDLFLYYKTVAIRIVAIIMICFLFCHHFMDKKKFHFGIFIIPLAIYSLLIILSMLFSEYSSFSLHGLEEQFETMYILLSYIIMVIYCYVFTVSEKDVKFIFKGWIVGIVLLCFVGLFQVFHYDLITSPFLQKIFSLGTDLSNYETKQLTNGNVFMTLYNSNYVGFFAVLTIPILTILYVFVTKKSTKIVLYIINCAAFLCLMGSGAKNGIISLTFCLILMVVLFRKNLMEHKVEFVSAFASFVIIFILFNTLNAGKISDSLENGITVKANEKSALEDIETTIDNVIITYSGNKLYCSFDVSDEGDYSLFLKDESGKNIATEQTEIAAHPMLNNNPKDTLDDSDHYSVYKITDERFPFTVGMSIIGIFNGFYVTIDDYTWGFTNLTFDEGYFYYTPQRKYARIETADTAIFTNYSSLASGRGYLWARTIPLLKNNILLGTGPDTFTLVFPQTDYVAAKDIGLEKLIVTKPHSLYLQIGVQTGVLSLLAFLSFNLIYIVSSFRIYWKKKIDCFTEYIGIGILIAVVGYLISGLVNDSTVTIAPVYWCLMGIGFSVNKLNTRDSDNL